MALKVKTKEHKYVEPDGVICAWSLISDVYSANNSYPFTFYRGRTHTVSYIVSCSIVVFEDPLSV